MEMNAESIEDPGEPSLTNVEFVDAETQTEDCEPHTGVRESEKHNAFQDCETQTEDFEYMFARPSRYAAIIIIIIIILYLPTCHLGAESSFKRERT